MGEITRTDIYKEQYAHFRSMNGSLYKIPPLFTAILGDSGTLQSSISKRTSGSPVSSSRSRRSEVFASSI